MKEQNSSCRICGNIKGNKKYIVKEMMFGTKEKFLYFKCYNCGCLQIEDENIDLCKYYSSGYYSFSVKSNRKRNKLDSMFDKICLNFIINTKFVNKIFPYEFVKPIDCLKGLNISINSKILDVGCGAGEWLDDISQFGFKFLKGVDLYIKGNIKFRENFYIQKGQIYDIKNEKFDIIAFNHSFEHMKEPRKIFNKIYELLSDKGVCIIRIPVVDCYAWKKYKTNWVQLDAPRHLYLNTKKSIEILAKNSKLKVFNITYDSTDFQFWGSEEYLKNIPLNVGRNRVYSLFSNDKIHNFKRKAKILNKKHLGDQAIFYISKKGR